MSKKKHHSYNFLTKVSKIWYQFESYILKCHCFTMFTITQTFSGKSVTLMVNAVFTARILTIFSIGLGTFWKTILMVIVNPRLSVHVDENLIASKLWNIYTSKSPVVQLWPIQPALQEHIPSVCRHVLQLGEHDR